ncbi:MAG: OprO/OprP family phosphate-selective porin, partial [Dysgonamonadaceae bacterium]|nr:OprO/OprP family phosphate-selective porin [Dysgonamonadaceae bacterium]
MKTKLTLLLCIYVISSNLFAQENKEITKKLKDAFTSEAFQLYGYGQIIYNISEHPDWGIERTTSNNSFDVARAILFATGKVGSQKQFGYMLMYDFGPNACLYELYGEWLPKNALNLRFGQFKIPFTIENPMSPTKLETIYFSRGGKAMSGSTGDFNQFEPNGAKSGAKAGRDAGLQLSGRLFKKDDFFRIEYYTGLFNGTGFNTKDNNNHKDFIGTVYYRPVKDLRIGGSIYSGKLNAPIYSIQGNHARDLWTIGAEYNSKKFYVRSEYIAANNGGLKRDGYYGSAVWKLIPDKWEVLGKYEYYDENKSFIDNEISDITVGVNYYFAFLTRIQLNYIYTDNKALGVNNAVAMQ